MRCARDASCAPDLPFHMYVEDAQEFLCNVGKKMATRQNQRRLLIAAAAYRKRINSNQKRKRVWVHEIFQSRKDNGAYHHLVSEHKLHGSYIARLFRTVSNNYSIVALSDILIALRQASRIRQNRSRSDSASRTQRMRNVYVHVEMGMCFDMKSIFSSVKVQRMNLSHTQRTKKKKRI